MFMIPIRTSRFAVKIKVYAQGFQDVVSNIVHLLVLWRWAETLRMEQINILL